MPPPIITGEMEQMTTIWFTMVVFLMGLGTLFAVITAYNYHHLPKEKRTSLDGVTTIEDAVRAAHDSGVEGWELVGFAQQLVARKFDYSRHNAWDSPARAFERGLGYCAQQALALQLIYQRLGVEARPVHAFRNQFPAKEIHGINEPARASGHVWLRVRIGEEVRDVCPGHIDNRPGVIHFQPLSRIRPYTRAFHLLAHWGCVVENFRRDIVARRRSTRQPGLASG
jgi:hypothetical protein